MVEMGFYVHHYETARLHRYLYCRTTTNHFMTLKNRKKTCGWAMDGLRAKLPNRFYPFSRPAYTWLAPGSRWGDSGSPPLNPPLYICA